MVSRLRSISLKKYLIALCASISVAPAALPQSAMQKVRVDIPVQDLSAALTQFGRETGTEIVFAPDAVREKKAAAVKGEFEREQAIALLLSGTGLAYRITRQGAIVVEPAKPIASASESDASSLRLAQANTPDQSSEASPSSAEHSDQNSKDDSGQGGRLEEIVVTAEKRTESIQRLPIAISAFSGETLTSRGVVDFEDLPRLTPSLQIGAKNSTGTQSITMRGVSSSFGDPTVSIVQDGVPVFSNLIDLDFWDTERVEVLRGPQGTLSGRNATAGAINIISKRPTEEFEGALRVTLGNYERIATEGYLSGPVAGDRLLGRMAARMVRAGGWVTNELNGQELGTVDKMDVRGSLVGVLSDDLQATLMWERNVNRSDLFNIINGNRVRADRPGFLEINNLIPFDWDNKGPVRRDDPSDAETRRDQVTLKLDWDVGSSAHIAAITGYRQHEFQGKTNGDSDGTELQVVVWNPDNRLRAWQVSQEVTFTADLTDRLDVTAGGLFLRGDLKEKTDLGLPFLGIPAFAVQRRKDDELSSWAGYTQWRYRLTDSTRLTAGLRYTNDTVTLKNGDPVASTDEATWSAWTPRLALDYMPNDHLALYASVSKGYKAGGFNGPASRFEPETVFNYETGLKANWFDKRLNTRVAGFYMDYQDLQNIVYNFETVGTFADIQNVNSVTIIGLELELDALLTDHLRITAGGSWLPKAEYDNLQSADPLYPELGDPGPGGINIRDLTGNRVVKAPKTQFNVSGQYTQPLSGGWQTVFTASYAWQSEVFFDFFNRPLDKQGSYGYLNLSGSIETMDGRWRLTAFANNATDTFYITEGAFSNFAGGFTTPWIGSMPRTYGLSLAHRF